MLTACTVHCGRPWETSCEFKSLEFILPLTVAAVPVFSHNTSVSTWMEEAALRAKAPSTLTITTCFEETPREAANAITNRVSVAASKLASVNGSDMVTCTTTRGRHEAELFVAGSEKVPVGQDTLLVVPPRQ